VTTPLLGIEIFLGPDVGNPRSHGGQFDLAAILGTVLASKTITALAGEAKGLRETNRPRMLHMKIRGPAPG